LEDDDNTDDLLDPARDAKTQRRKHRRSGWPTRRSTPRWNVAEDDSFDISWSSDDP
jgi:hypothetical protein